MHGEAGDRQKSRHRRLPPGQCSEFSPRLFFRSSQSLWQAGRTLSISEILARTVAIALADDTLDGVN